MSVMTSLTNEQRMELARAQTLEIRRERHNEALAQLPMPKAETVEFPYAGLDEALDDGFRKLPGGSAELMRLAKAAWKTKQWRKAAERNRATRDAMAEGPEAIEEGK